MSATILPHPALTAVQLGLICDREGLEVEHLGDAIFRLIQTSAPRRSFLRIAMPPDFRRDRRRTPRGTEPEAA